MSIVMNRIISLLATALAGAAAGRLTVRGILNLLLGGTMFGGNFL